MKKYFIRVPDYVGEAVSAGSLGVGTLQTVFRHSDPAAKYAQVITRAPPDLPFPFDFIASLIL